MAHTDPVSDMLTRIRNAQMRRQTEISFSASKLKLEIVRLLKEHGYISTYEITEQDKKHSVTISLAVQGKNPIINGLERLSKPGQRLYADASMMKKFRKRNHLTIVSTSSGVMTTHEALKKNIGGELVCTIW